MATPRGRCSIWADVFYFSICAILWLGSTRSETGHRGRWNLARSRHAPAIPVGLGMALVHNQQALTKFSALTDEEKRAFIAGVHGIDSRQEMRAYVDRFAES